MSHTRCRQFDHVAITCRYLEVAPKFYTQRYPNYVTFYANLAKLFSSLYIYNKIITVIALDGNNHSNKLVVLSIFDIILLQIALLLKRHAKTPVHFVLICMFNIFIISRIVFFCIYLPL